MARVATAHGFLDASLVARFIPPDFMAKLPPDVSEVALVKVTDSDTGARSTIIGDARLFRGAFARYETARLLGDETFAYHLATDDLADVCPIEQTGWLEDWIADLQEVLDTLPVSLAGT